MMPKNISWVNISPPAWCREGYQRMGYVWCPMFLAEERYTEAYRAAVAAGSHLTSRQRQDFTGSWNEMRKVLAEMPALDEFEAKRLARVWTVRLLLAGRAREAFAVACEVA